jgi:hypothetical protein
MSNYKDFHDQRATAEPPRSYSIDSNRLTANVLDLQQARLLATRMLRENGAVLAKNQAHTLQKFLLALKTTSPRKKITRAQCNKILNIAKQAQHSFSTRPKKIRRLRKQH